MAALETSFDDEGMDEFERIRGKPCELPKSDEMPGDWMKAENRRKKPPRFVGPAKGK